MQIESIHLYPLKGARGVQLERAEVLRSGLRRDRRFMLVDAKGIFVTQRTHPRLALVPVESKADAVTIAGVDVPLEHEGPLVSVRVFDEEAFGMVVHGDAARAVSDHLGEEVSLLFMPDDVRRQVDLRYARPGDHVGFADGFPVLLATTASLDDLSVRIGEPIPMNRFRPNLVVSGGAPWEEEQHAHVRVGALTFRMPKRCSRCPVTLVNQDTAEIGKEPLRTLATFRKSNNKVYFAQNCIPDGEGFVAVGDAVTYLDPI